MTARAKPGSTDPGVGGACDGAAGRWRGRVRLVGSAIERLGGCLALRRQDLVVFGAARIARVGLEGSPLSVRAPWCCQAAAGSARIALSALM